MIITFQPLEHHLCKYSELASEMPLELQKAFVSVSASAELETKVFDGAVDFLKYDLMLGAFADTFLLCLSLFISLSNARLPLILNANHR